MKREWDHIVMPTIGSAGDVFPVVGIGRALRARGYPVTIVTNPYFEALIRENGLGFHPLGTVEDYIEVTENPDLWHPVRGFHTVARFGLIPGTERLYDFLKDLDPAGTLIAASGLAFGARVAQEHLGFRLVTVHLQPVIFRSVYDSPVMGGVRPPDWLPRAAKRAYYHLLDRWIIDRVLGPTINAFRASLGLAPARSFMGSWYHSPDRVIGLFPDWYAPPQPDWPPQTILTGFLRYDADEENPPAPVLTAFLAAGEPPILFTAGSSNIHARHFFHESVKAVQLLGRRAIMVTRHRPDLPDSLPENICHVDFVPFSRVLGQTAGIVHHGGIGTSAKALAAGIPQLIMPLAHDQPDNARRLRLLGVADTLRPAAYRATTAAAALAALSNTAAVRQRAETLAERIDFEAAMAATCEAITTV